MVKWSGRVDLDHRPPRPEPIGFSSPELQAPSTSGGISLLSLNPCGRRRGRKVWESWVTGEDTLAVEISALLFCHAAEQLYTKLLLYNRISHS